MTINTILLESFADFANRNFVLLVSGLVLIIVTLVYFLSKKSFVHRKCKGYSSRKTETNGQVDKYRYVDVRIDEDGNYAYHDQNGRWYFLTEKEIAQINGEVEGIEKNSFDLPTVRLTKPPKKIVKSIEPVLNM